MIILAGCHRIQQSNEQRHLIGCREKRPHSACPDCTAQPRQLEVANPLQQNSPNTKPPLSGPRVCDCKRHRTHHSSNSATVRPPPLLCSQPIGRQPWVHDCKPAQ